MSRLLYSWNVNGIRAAQGKGLSDWIASSGAYCISLQETKAEKAQLGPDLLEIPGYKVVFHSATCKKGYSGVATYYKEEPLEVENLGAEEFDREGRGQLLHYPDFTLINCYFPNSQEAGARLDYKIQFCDMILEKCKKLTADGKNILLCGDYNIAHQPMDLAHPESNQKNPGYLPEERAWMTKFLSSGFCDTFRTLHPEDQVYSWWSYRFHAREKNVGWRIDYWCTNQSNMPRIQKAAIHNDVFGSDHCPVSVEI